jgi:tetratricopeptide (TPR) repeat protein
MMQRAVATAHREGSDEIAALWLANGSLREALFGEAAQAKNLAAQALQISPSRDIRIAVATAFAAIGESGQAQKLLEQLNTESPMNTLVQNYWLPIIKSLLALHKGDAKQAIALLDVTRSYELGIQNTSIMMPIYVRGLAYAKAGQPEEAAAEFGKMLAHRGLGENQPIQGLALLQLGRAKAAAGDKPYARRSYQDLLALWRQADPNLSLLHQAQAEYDKLKD